MSKSKITNTHLSVEKAALIGQGILAQQQQLTNELLLQTLIQNDSSIVNTQAFKSFSRLHRHLDKSTADFYCQVHDLIEG